MDAVKSPTIWEEKTFITGMRMKTKVYETEFDKDIENYKD